MSAMDFEEYESQESEVVKRGPEDRHDWSIDRYTTTLICQECDALYRTSCDKKGYSDDPEGSEYLCQVCCGKSEDDDDCEPEDDALDAQEADCEAAQESTVAEAKAAWEAAGKPSNERDHVFEDTFIEIDIEPRAKA